MTVTIEVTEDQAEKMLDHLQKAKMQYRNMARDARRSGDRHAVADFKAEVATCTDLVEIVSEAADMDKTDMVQQG